MDLSHVYDLLRLSLRCTLRFKSKPLCRLNFDGITIAYNRETLSEFSGLFIFNKAGDKAMEIYFEKLVRENFRFGRMCSCNFIQFIEIHTH